MKYKELRKEFLNFFKEKGHMVVPSSSLKPINSSVLFTTAGMQQFTLYLTGEKDAFKDFGNNRLSSCQKCFRTDDIDEVGDKTHHTFFEMLGNWSIGDEKDGYFKEGAIEYALEFLINVLKVDKEKLFITVFKGTKETPKDDEARKIWLKKGFSENKIREFEKDNFWGPVGGSGPCGPSSEIFYDRGEEIGCGDSNCGPNCPKCNRFVEIWNLVFMQYFKEENGSYRLLEQTNIDTGMGLERMLSILQEKPSAYQTDLFLPIIKKIEEISGKKYNDEKRIFRILADHIRGVVFLASEGINPSNLGQGYILRRLLRRMIRLGRKNKPGESINLPKDFLIILAREVIENYKEFYPIIKTREDDILDVFTKEQDKFSKTLERGLRELNKLEGIGEIEEIKNGKIPIINRVSAKDAFNIFQTYGFPLEMIQEELARKALLVDEEEFKEEFKKEFQKHQEVSRAGAEKKFGGVGKDADYQSTKLHTATHLLHQALRVILGDHVQQRGSDINPQRLRFDFNHSQKIEEKDLKKIEDLINQKIQEGLDVKKEEMKLKDALQSGVLAFFKDKYPEKVTVYSMGDFSKEICAGPHVKNTSELGRFKILKEKSSSSGVRRIKAILE